VRLQKSLNYESPEVLLRYYDFEEKINERNKTIEECNKIIEIYKTNDALTDSDIANWIICNVSKHPLPKLIKHEEIIDIIIPVYNGIEYFDALFGSLTRTDVKYNLFVIDDCSTDMRVSEYLRNLANKDSRVTIIENKENLGFVQSVNKVFDRTENHIALLNSDIDLPPYWLERLMHPILNKDKIASSTPFTNCGTLCSFPRVGEDNPLFESLSCDVIDSVFRQILPSYTEIPTGVGFCMGINKDVLRKIGYFDAETFTKGYGEENDWCQRAIQAGYKNVHVENLFVYHKHCGSFPTEEKNELIEKNSKLLSEKHPMYFADVAEYFLKNQLKTERDIIAMLLLSRHISRKQILVFDHNLGGGASMYLHNAIQEKLVDGDSVITVRYDVERRLYLFDYKCKDYVFAYSISRVEDIRYILANTGCHEIIINELVTYPKLYKLLSFIAKTKREYDAKLTMLLHDYFAVCPSVFLVNGKHSYCGLPDEKICGECFDRLFSELGYKGIGFWRAHWGDFLHSCTEIVAFSNASRAILEEAYGTMSNILVKPHNVDYIIKPGKSLKITNTINIGLIGFLASHKGFSIINEMLGIIEQKELNVRIILIGDSYGQIQHESFYETGAYRKESIPLLTMQNDIDIFFISSIWPETFSYTTEEAMKMEMPVAAFNIGAPAERLANYNKGVLIETIDAEAALNRIVEYYNDSIFDPEKQDRNIRILFIGEYISFSSRYRVEHFREQLLVEGISSDYIDKDELSEVEDEQYYAVVFYRCRFTMDMEIAVGRLKKRGKKVYYDIDDFIFSYNEIKDLAFLSGEEYKDFDKYSDDIWKGMSLCDGFITSTNNMKLAIQKEFPQKPIVINRNVASIEMASLSISARSNAMKATDKVTLGYFSGSKTHDADFEIISNVVIKLMDKYDNLHLMIGGCLNLPDAFEEYKDRVILSGFVDWRELPALIASVDINLMPLEDTFFHSCKSENKWLEAALVSVPTVCSINDELEPIIKNGVTGFLCHDEDEWETVLSKLIEEPNLREQVGKAASDVVFEKYITTVSGKDAMSFILM